MPSGRRPATPRSLALLGGGQRRLEVVDEIALVLKTDRKPDQLLTNAGRVEGGCVHLLVRRARRMNDERFGVPHIGKVGEDLDRLDESPARLPSALDAETHDGSSTLGQNLTGEIVIGMVRKLGIA